MQTPISLLKKSSSLKISAKTPGEFMSAVGGPLFSITMEKLVSYRKRIDATVSDPEYNIYRSCGVYFIEFPGKIYIGSTANYFGRRWKSHITGNMEMECLNSLFDSNSPSDIIFHAIAICGSESECRFIELGLIRLLENSCQDISANPLGLRKRKQRQRNAKNDKARERERRVTEFLTSDQGGMPLPL